MNDWLHESGGRFGRWEEEGGEMYTVNTTVRHVQGSGEST